MRTKTQTKEKAQNDERSVNDHKVFGYLREIRAAVQDIQLSITEIRKKLPDLDADKRVPALLEIFSSNYQTRIEQNIKPQLDAIQNLFDIDEKELDWASDNVTSIRLNWARAKDLWPAADASFDVIDHRLNDISPKLDQIVYQCCTLTLSPRVNDVLENLRTGQALDFDFEFGSELPIDPQLRNRLFLELAQQGAVLSSGVVDVNEQVIYKAAASRQKQRYSAVRLVLCVILGAIVVPGAIVLAKQADLGLFRSLIREYVLIFAGAGAHIAINALKIARSQTRPGFQAINDWILWLHVREVKVFWGIAYVWLGCVLLAMTAGVDDLKMYSAFFAGYSIDSIVEVFLGRFESAIKTNTDNLTSVANSIPKI